MPLTFKKAPLVELIAELKWALPGAPPPDVAQMPGMPFPIFHAAGDEEFFMRFGAQAHQQGFSNAERIIPPGFPSPPFQVVYRYRKSGVSKDVLQVGPGVFSANALRPYQSWHIFRPSVGAGISALLEARAPADKESPFTAVTIRYVNSFTKELTGGRDSATFIRDVLGIKTELPPAVAKYMAADTLPIPNFSFGFPTNNGLKMTVTVADGVIEGGPSCILDMSVQTIGKVAPNADAVLAVLDAGRGVLHNAFLGMVEPIRAQLDPEGIDEG